VWQGACRFARAAALPYPVTLSRRSLGSTMSSATSSRKGRAVGINHIALEVADIAAALDFYGKFLDFELHEQNEDQAFIYFGDQFINFTRHADRLPDQRRHFGIAVDDRELVRSTLKQMGVELLEGPFLDFLDPWGNRVEIVGYDNIQFTKAPHVLRGMGLENLSKNDSATKELREKGMAPD
jgi:predicted enzyme related to lactoylglutathione lyase